MSSETSTDAIRLKPDSTSGAGDGNRGGRLQPDRSPQAEQSLQPWQFFVLAALGCATALTFLVRGQGVIVVVLVTIIMAACALVGMATLWTVRPLVSPHDDKSVMFGERTRAALEHEKALSLRTIKELEFDKAMGKISEEDFREMSVRLRARASRLLRQLDASQGYRTQIERDLAKRMGETAEKPRVAPVCAKCSTTNDPDARYCKQCGDRL